MILHGENWIKASRVWFGRICLEEDPFLTLTGLEQRVKWGQYYKISVIFLHRGTSLVKSQAEVLSVHACAWSVRIHRRILFC
jgi:hypothetical protein